MRKPTKRKVYQTWENTEAIVETCKDIEEGNAGVLQASSLAGYVASVDEKPSCQPPEQ